MLDPSQRNASSRTSWHEWRRKLWGNTPKKGGRPLRKDDLSSSIDSDEKAFNLGHRISAKAAAQPRLRCTELDENGKVVLANGEFKKSELIAKVGITLPVNFFFFGIVTLTMVAVWTSPSRSEED